MLHFVLTLDVERQSFAQDDEHPEEKVKNKQPKLTKTEQGVAARLLVCNLNPQSTEDSVKNYVEIVTGQAPDNIIFNADHTNALLSMNNKLGT